MLRHFGSSCACLHSALLFTEHEGSDHIKKLTSDYVGCSLQGVKELYLDVVVALDLLLSGGMSAAHLEAICQEIAALRLGPQQLRIVRRYAPSAPCMLSLHRPLSIAAAALACMTAAVWPACFVPQNAYLPLRCLLRPSRVR